MRTNGMGIHAAAKTRAPAARRQSLQWHRARKGRCTVRSEYGCKGRSETEGMLTS